MPKTNYVPVQGLASIGGEKPVGVQTRFKAATGPFLPRSVDPDGGVVTISTWRRGDVTLKHIDDLPVQREDLIAGEILEVAAGDLQAAYEILTRARGQRDRAISEASGYDGTTVGPDGETVHADADGTVLTDAEVAALRGVATGPTVEEAEAWWEEQEYLPGVDYADVEEAAILDVLREQGPAPIEAQYIGVLERTLISPRDTVLAAAVPVSAALADARVWWAQQTYHEGLGFSDVSESEMVDLVGRIPLNEVEHVRALDDDLCWGEDGPRRVLDAIDARLADHEAAVTAPGWSPLEAGLPVVEVRRRLGTISDPRIVADLFVSEKNGSGRKRVLQAVDARLEQLGGPAAKAAVPPLPGEDEPVAAVDEEPFG